MREHIASRPNRRTGAGPDSPWLFPSTLAGRHLHPNTVMDRLRDLGINLRAARNRAIGELVLECPPSLVADALRYSQQVAFLHADKAAEPWAPATPVGASAARSQRTAVPPCSLAVGPRPSRLGVASGPLTWHAVDLHKHGLSLIGCIMESLDETGLSTLTDRTSDGHLR